MGTSNISIQTELLIFPSVFLVSVLENNTTILAKTET